MTKSAVGEPTPGATTMWGVVDLAVREIGQARRLDAEAMRVCMSLYCAADTISYDIRQSVKIASSKPTAYLDVLLVLSLFDSVEMRDLSRLLNKSRAATSIVVNQLVEDGFVERAPSRDDRRVSIVTATDVGREYFDEIFSVYNERETHWTGGLDRDEQRQLVGLLGKLINHRLDDHSASLRK